MLPCSVELDFFTVEGAFSSWLFTHVDAERLSRTSADHRGRSECVGIAWKKVSDLRDLCYGHVLSQYFSPEARLSFVCKVLAFHLPAPALLANND